MSLLKSKITKTKKEFRDFKTGIIETMNNFKEQMSQYIQNDVESEMKNVII